MRLDPSPSCKYPPQNRLAVIPPGTTLSLSAVLRQIILKKNGLTVGEAALRLEIGRPALSNVLNDSGDLSIALAVKIESAFGYSALSLLQYQLARKLLAYRHQHPKT